MMWYRTNYLHVITICTIYITDAVNEDYEIMLQRARCESKCIKQFGIKRSIRNNEENTGIFTTWSCRSDACQNCKTECQKEKDGVKACQDVCRNKENSEICFGRCSPENGSGSNSVRELDVILKPGILCQFNTKRTTGNHTATVYMIRPLRHSEHSLPGHTVFVTSKRRKSSTEMKVLWQDMRIVYSNRVGFRSLDLGSTYAFRLTAVTDEGVIGNASDSGWIKTRKERSLTSTPQYIRVIKQRLWKGRMSALLSWVPGEDLPCFYRIYAMDNCKLNDYKEEEIKLIPRSQCWLNDLHFSCNYTVKLQPYGGNLQFSDHGYSINTSFVTMDCLNITNYNYTICAPDKVSEITYIVDDVYVRNNSKFGNVTIRWKPPIHSKGGQDILSYHVLWQKDVEADNFYHLKYLEPHKGEVTVSGNTSYIHIQGIHWYNTYRVDIISTSKGGKSHPTVKMINFGDVPVFSLKTKTNDKSQNLTQRSAFIISVSASLMVIVIIIVIVLCVKWRRDRHGMNSTKERRIRNEEFNPIYRCGVNNSSCEPLIDDLEIDFYKLTLLETIGEGAFGKVHKAEYMSATQGVILVAAKMLKGIADRNEQRNLMCEIKAMKQLGHHPNIVSMLGYCTRGPGFCLLMDYCPLGDLRKYLLNRRHKTIMAAQTNKRSCDSGFGVNSQMCATDQIIDSTSDSNDVFLQEATLLSYARQISMGMEFLSAKKFVHRDLAARNILMYDRKRLKLSDFGLTRDVYETDVYQPTSARKLPYKWMAIESIFDQMFTIKSDVWSFGIVLWEIVTLGGSPYPGIPNEDLFHLLKDGYRMERPENCSSEIYQMMLSSWHPNPTCRPSFTELRLKLESMLEMTKSYINLSVNVSQDYYQNDASSTCGTHRETNDDVITDTNSCYIDTNVSDTVKCHDPDSNVINDSENSAKEEIRNNKTVVEVEITPLSSYNHANQMKNRVELCKSNHRTDSFIQHIDQSVVSRDTTRDLVMSDILTRDIVPDMSGVESAYDSDSPDSCTSWTST